MTRHFSWLYDHAEKVDRENNTITFDKDEIEDVAGDTDHLSGDAQDVLNTIFMDMDSKGLSEITYYI